MIVKAIRQQVMTMKETLTREVSEDYKLIVADSCGWLASVAVDEIFEDAWFHGKNQICQLKEKEDHIVVLIDSDCPDRLPPKVSANRPDSVISELCQQGIVMYYYHTIKERHHHVCLALKKKSIIAEGPIGHG